MPRIEDPSGEQRHRRCAWCLREIAAREILPLLVGDLRAFGKHRGVVLPDRKIEQPRPRTVRRRVPVGGAGGTWERRLAERLWRRDWAASGGIQPAGPVHLRKGAAQQELSRHPIEDIEEANAIAPETPQ